MADYSQNEINSMRQDAIRRVREMQGRSQNYIRGSAQEIAQAGPPEPPVQHPQSSGQNVNFPPFASPPPNRAPGPSGGGPHPSGSGWNNGFSNGPAMSAPPHSGTNPGGNPGPGPGPGFGGGPGPGGLGGLGGGLGNIFSSLFGGRPPALTDQQQPKEGKGLLGGLLDNFFPNLHLDEDKIIIIMLIILLARSGSDIKLLLALGYLLM